LDNCQPDDYEKVIRCNLQKSLTTLHLDYADAYLLHSARYAFRPDILAALSVMQREGLARKVGVSVYEPEEAISCYESPYVDFIQAPYSIFDHRMKEHGVLDMSKKGDCELHTRSAFIQGLILLEEKQVPSFLESAKPIVRRIGTICKDTGINRIALAMAYVKKEKAISHLVFGVDSLEQLKEDIRLFEQDLPANLLAQMDTEFEGIETGIVMPSLWKK
jgi:aryl-alcohol dehydrogenase-like predicted oxidoreductase